MKRGAIRNRQARTNSLMRECIFPQASFVRTLMFRLTNFRGCCLMEYDSYNFVTRPCRIHNAYVQRLDERFRSVRDNPSSPLKNAIRRPLSPIVIREMHLQPYPDTKNAPPLPPNARGALRGELSDAS